MAVAHESELKQLCALASTLAGLSVDGLVTGFLHNGKLDRPSMSEILSMAPHTKVTFHRAFDDLLDTDATIEELRRFPQIDRILTNGGHAPAIDKLNRVTEWQTKAGPRLTMLFAVGLDAAAFPALANYPCIREVHTGRAVREPQTTFGSLKASRVAALKKQLHTLTDA